MSLLDLLGLGDILDTIKQSVREVADYAGNTVSEQIDKIINRMMVKFLEEVVNRMMVKFLEVIFFIVGGAALLIAAMLFFSHYVSPEFILLIMGLLFVYAGIMIQIGRRRRY